MPITIELPHKPAGYVREIHAHSKQCSIETIGFYTSDDGYTFVQKLEGLVDTLVQWASTPPIKPSQVDHILAVFFNDRKATVHLNDLSMIFTAALATGTKAKDDPVFTDEVVDIAALRLLDIDIPNDAGVLLLLSAGWKKGLFFDFGPLGPERTPRTFDCTQAFGALLARLLFRDRFAITEQEWLQLYRVGWFPFSGLPDSTVRDLIVVAKHGGDMERVVEKCAKDVTDRIDLFLQHWQQHVVLNSHISILERGVNHFKNGDFISCTSMMFPRIEGLLRTHAARIGVDRCTQRALAASVEASAASSFFSLLLPERFAAYLESVYFANFDPAVLKQGISRNTVCHGVASVESFSLTAALHSILIVEQLSRLLPRV